MRLRFAPSPTGSLHLGNARTALVNWLAARAAGGALVLRVEDTDQERSVAGATRALIDSLRWLGIDWEEGPDVGGPHGPYRQSQRGERYAAAVGELLDHERAYYCFEDPERLRAQRSAADAAGECFEYPGRAIDAAQARRRVAAGEAAAVRFRAPDDAVAYRDGLRGELLMQAEEVGDFVVARADGTATYQLAVVVDDHDMQIDHVIRGQDHLANTPRQQLLYDALHWPRPRFTHLPLLLGADRSRLSKRHGAVSVEEMRRQGVLPEALANYLALVGWAAPADGEILSLHELVELFRVENLSAVNAAFDRDKLDWVNQQHLGRLDRSSALARARPFLQQAGYEVPDEGAAAAWWGEVIALVLPSVRRLDELPARLQPLFAEPADRGPVGERQRSVLAAFQAASEGGELTTAESFRAAAKGIGAATGSKGRELFVPLRTALTGEEHGPELARLIPLLEGAAAAGIVPPVAGVAQRLRRGLRDHE